MDICEKIKELVAQPCWAAIAGKGTGSMLSLQFGPMIPLARPVENPHLPEAARNFDGTWCLWVFEASWRLRKNGAVICGSSSDNSADGEMISGLEQMVDAVVESAQVDAETGDLRLILSGGLKFDVFCDCVDVDGEGANYSFFSDREDGDGFIWKAPQVHGKPPMSR